jgi:hypothetical protein
MALGGLWIPLAACSLGQGPKDPEEPKQAGSQWTQMAIDIQNLKQSLTALLGALQSLEKDVKLRDLRHDDKIQELQLAVNELLSKMGKVDPTTSKPEPVPGPSAPPSAVTDPVRLLAATGARMRAATLSPSDVEEVRASIRPILPQALEYLMNELKGAVKSLTDADARFVGNFKAVLIGLPFSELVRPFESALREDLLRMVICDTIGLTGHPDLGKLLRPYINTPDENFRAQVGEALVRCKDEGGVPLLLILLRSATLEFRTIALAALRKIAPSNTAFGYDSYLPPDSETNKDAIKKWDAWYDASKGRIFVPR